MNNKIMNVQLGFLGMLLIISSCNTNNKQTRLSLIGTWELISASSTEKDSTVSTFNPKVKMIKIINPTHFAFFSHDLNNGKDSTTASFVAGGGSYTLVDSNYTEHLEYFINREWENNKFEFVVSITNDTLIQKGIEKIEKLGVDHLIVEKYKKLKN